MIHSRARKTQARHRKELEKRDQKTKDMLYLNEEAVHTQGKDRLRHENEIDQRQRNP